MPQLAGWAMSSTAVTYELGVSPTSAGFQAYGFLLRWPAPAAVLCLIGGALLGN